MEMQLLILHIPFVSVSCVACLHLIKSVWLCSKNPILEVTANVNRHQCSVLGPFVLGNQMWFLAESKESPGATQQRATKPFSFLTVDHHFLLAAHHVPRWGASKCGGEEDESGARAGDPQRRRRPSRYEAQRPRPRRLQGHHGKRDAPRTRWEGAATSGWHGPKTRHGLRARLRRPRRRPLYYPAPLRRAPPPQWK